MAYDHLIPVAFTMEDSTDGETRLDVKSYRAYANSNLLATHTHRELRAKVSRADTDSLSDRTRVEC